MLEGMKKKIHLHAHASHQGKLFGLKQWPRVVFKELKTTLPLISHLSLNTIFIGIRSNPNRTLNWFTRYLS